MGETLRPLHQRYTEHFNSARNPLAPSYLTKPTAKHFTAHHPGEEPNLQVEVLEHASSTINRKIKEAKNIVQLKPDMNCRDEMIECRQFLVNID